MSAPLRWYDHNADNPPWLKALAEVRIQATREGWCHAHVQAIIVAIDQYAEAALGNRSYFLNKPYGVEGGEERERALKVRSPHERSDMRDRGCGPGRRPAHRGYGCSPGSDSSNCEAAWFVRRNPEMEFAVSSFSLELPTDFGDYEWILESKGWFSEARIVVAERRYRVNFYDLARLTQTVEGEFERGQIKYSLSQTL